MTVCTRRRGDDVEISVADEGPGIPERIRQNLFEPFVTTKPEGKGTGLGLSTVLMVVERHNGHVDFDTTEAPGHHVPDHAAARPPAEAEGRLLGDGQLAALDRRGVPGLETAVEREDARPIGREVERRRPAGHDPLLDPQRVDREAVLAVRRGQDDAHALSPAQRELRGLEAARRGLDLDASAAPRAGAAAATAHGRGRQRQRQPYPAHGLSAAGPGRGPRRARGRRRGRPAPPGRRSRSRPPPEGPWPELWGRGPPGPPVRLPAARAALRRGPALGLLEEGLAREPDLAGGVDADDLHQDLVAFLHLVADVLDAVVGHLRDVQQAVGPGQDLHEGAELDHPDHLAQVGLVELRRSR